MNYTTLQVPNDTLYIAATNEGLCYVGNDVTELEAFAIKRKETLHENDEAMRLYATQFQAYFSGDLKTFDAPQDVIGTDLQRQVWATLQQIPYGDVWAYQDVANAIGRPTAVRAVANAIGRNPLLIVIPCHRVIGKNGKLTGFRSGLAMKRTLLAIEGLTQYTQ